MSPPQLQVRILSEQSELHVGNTHPLNLIIELTAQRPLSAGVATRPPLRVVFALDVSGSMIGPPLEHVTQAVDRLVALLQPSDQVGIVAFSNRAFEVVPLAFADADHRRLVRRRIARLQAHGATHVEAGLLKAHSMFPTRAPHERHALLLLSDGEPNEGRATLDELTDLARQLRPHLSLTTLGFGAHHNEDILAGMANAGGGLYNFIPDPRQCDFELARALGQQGDVAADAVRLVLRPAPGVEVERVLGQRPTRFSAEGLLIDLPDLLHAQPQITIARLRVTAPRERGPFDLLHAHLSLRPAGAPLRHEHTEHLRLTATSRTGARDPDLTARVLLARADEARAEARNLADRSQFDGAAAVLRQLIAELRQLPGLTEGDGSPAAEALDLLLDEAMAYERNPSAENYKNFKRTSMTTTLSSRGTQASQLASLSRDSQSLIFGAAGDTPDAELIGVGGPVLGQRVHLKHDQLFGRTSSADVQLHDRGVSRSHARITAQGGAFLLIDLNSTNATLLNGRPLHGSHPLRSGDVIILGECIFRYEQR